MATLRDTMFVGSDLGSMMAGGRSNLLQALGKVNAINNNLANAFDNGYKAIISRYNSTPGGVDLAFSVDWRQGALGQGQALSAAIQGDGVFVVDEFGLQSGKRLYTRKGEFQMAQLQDGNQYLVDINRRPVYGFTVDANRNPTSTTATRMTFSDPSGVSIDTDGTVISSTGQPLYKLALAKFVNPEQLNPREGTAFAETFRSGRPLKIISAGEDPSFGTVIGQRLESSNVVISDQNVESILNQRLTNALMNNTFANLNKIYSSTLSTIV